jgi:hypothetical protein
MLHPSTELFDDTFYDDREYTSSALRAFPPMETKLRASRYLHSGPSCQMRTGRTKRPSKLCQPHFSAFGFLQTISSHRHL